MRFVGAFAGAFADAVKRKCDSYVMGYNTIIGRVISGSGESGLGWDRMGLGWAWMTSVLLYLVIDLNSFDVVVVVFDKFEMIRSTGCCLLFM